ncbi:GNAT family N-acetyltransferase [Nocardioides jensenii]|uniref:GNAT family N-acetyltransferase n=1 Tax=Nocardioides jensenii TaxID=1843 RepID=UPI000835D8AA|nr:GNAT family N-acetyltransferase [Nocardioides jensenii]
MSAAVTLEMFTDPRPFLAAAGEHLAADPVTGTVIATVSEQMVRSLEAGDPPAQLPYEMWWAVIRDASGAVVGEAMRTAPFAPYPLFVLAMPEIAARELARILHSRGEEVGGVNGALPAAWQVADELAALTGGTARVWEHTRLFELGDLVEPERPTGSLRAARIVEGPLALDWFRDFHTEADKQAGREPDPSLAEHVGIDDVLVRIEEGRIWFWVDENDRPVHLTGASAPSYGVARIGPVYTPPEQRGRGYASAAVAAVSRRILDDGVRACLFTDQANPVSNAIYQRLGYRPVVDMGNLHVRG